MANFFSELGAYTSIPSALVFDSTMSDRARFVYCYMACKGSDWDFVLSRMSEELGYGVVTLRKYIGELISHGWLSKGEQRNEGGCFGSVCYTLHAEPCIKNCVSQNLRVAKNVLRSKTDENMLSREYNIFYNLETSRNNLKDRDDELVNDINREDDKYTETLFNDDDVVDNVVDVDDVSKEIKEKKLSAKKEKKKAESDLFERCWVCYNRKGSKKKSREQWDKLTERERSMVMPHIRAYVGSRQLCYQRDFERYLRDRVFLDTVFSGKHVVYDPSRSVGCSEYVPATDGQIHWNDSLRCWLFTGFDETCIFDGYEDTSRPDGAEIRMNNGRGVVRWDANLLKWVKK